MRDIFLDNQPLTMPDEVYEEYESIQITLLIHKLENNEIDVLKNETIVQVSKQDQ